MGRLPAQNQGRGVAALEAAAFCEVSPGAVMEVRWGEDNRIKATRTSHGLVVAYSAAKTGEEIAEALELIYNTRSNRWYWQCPDCSRRVTRLHKPYDKLRYRCRHCHDLTYSVQERRKYHGLVRSLVKGMGVPARFMERFLQFDWGNR